MIKVNSTKVELKHFPDGTFLLKLEEIHDEADIEWRYENDAELVALIYISKHYQSSGAKIYLEMPYCPNARMDRIKSNGIGELQDVFTLKYFAEIINSLGFEEVRITDIHSNVGAALFNNYVGATPKWYIQDIIVDIKNMTETHNLLLFYPDEGSAKRYSDMINLPYAFGIKKRDWQTGKILGLDVIDNGETIKDRTILIIDDICSKGGTFYHSAKKLKELGAGDIYLYITHCENTILEGELIKSGLIKHIYTTNSIFTKEHELITVINKEMCDND